MSTATRKERDRQYARARYQAKRAAGECSWSKAKAAPGHVMCAAHLRKVKEDTRKYKRAAVLEIE